MTFTRDPVTIVNAITTFVGAVIAILVGTGVIDEAVGGAVIAIFVALSALVQQLVVRPATVPRVPLEELAAAEAAAATEVFTPPPNTA